MPKKKKEERYEVTPYGLILTIIKDEKKALEILEQLELVCRRKNPGRPALLLNGTESKFVTVEETK